MIVQLLAMIGAGCVLPYLMPADDRKPLDVLGCVLSAMGGLTTGTAGYLLM